MRLLACADVQGDPSLRRKNGYARDDAVHKEISKAWSDAEKPTVRPVKAARRI
jgi:hypothetical protein